MLWLAAVVIAAVSNLDNLAAGVAFGMRDTRIAAAPNAMIAAVTMAATAGAMTSGRALSNVLPPSLAAALGASIISAIGVWTILASLHALRSPASSAEPAIGSLQRNRHRPSLGPGRNKVVSLHEAFVLGVALSINNAAAGVGAGIAGVSPLATTLLAGALSLICIAGGSRVGLSLGRLVGGSRASVISGLILLGLGAMILTGAA
jgi:putative sporulation protein YtaF